jgi:hypothetical protein
MDENGRKYVESGQTKKATRSGQLISLSIAVTYLQLAQVQVEPQLQSTHVQFGLLHLTLIAFRAVLLIVVDFII